MWIKEKFSREYHVVCNGKTNRPSEKRSIDRLQNSIQRMQFPGMARSMIRRNFLIFKPDCAPSLSSGLLRIKRKRASNLEQVP